MASSAPDKIEIACRRGAEILPFIPDAARLRMTVFREWPYLYEGDEEYERDYLRTYSGHPDSLFVVARAGGEVVGISSGIPLVAETDEVKSPFIAAGIEPAEVFYFGESVLLPAWRGRGVGVRFFEEREAFARLLAGVRIAAFCAVDRAADHPMRPADYVALDGFWKNRGFVKSDLRTEFTWREIGEDAPSPKPLTFWLKDLR